MNMNSFTGNVNDRAFGQVYFRGRLILASLFAHMLARQGSSFIRSICPSSTGMTYV
jgi:hypothetical protein